MQKLEVNKEAVYAVQAYIRDKVAEGYRPDDGSYSFEKFLRSKNAWNGADDSGSRLKIKCPFHKDRTPSCIINPEDNDFYCFSCESHGTLIDMMFLYSRKVENSNIGYYQLINNILSDDKRMQLMIGFTTIYSREEHNVLKEGFKARSFKPRARSINDFSDLYNVMQREKLITPQNIKLAILYMQDGYPPSVIYKYLKGESGGTTVGDVANTPIMNLSDIMAGIAIGGEE